MSTYSPATQAKLDEVVAATDRYGDQSIIALSGVPGTGKSHVALPAAQAVASDPLMVREIQFHPAVGYEDFVEGIVLERDGVSYRDGVFLEINQDALNDPDHIYVLLIEELTRADLHSVLGDLLTYLEHRERPMQMLYSRRQVRVAPNLRVIATFNPSDRTAIDLDGALLRRLRVVDFPPDPAQLTEMLTARQLSRPVIEALRGLFDACASAHPVDFQTQMPFGHGIFSQVRRESPDLHDLWTERIVRMLRRPLLEAHPFTDTIEANYPWRDPAYSIG